MLNKHFPVQNIIVLCQNDTNMIDIKLTAYLPLTLRFYLFIIYLYLFTY